MSIYYLIIENERTVISLLISNCRLNVSIIYKIVTMLITIIFLTLLTPNVKMKRDFKKIKNNALLVLLLLHYSLT
jgi:hypothetical protein